MSKHGKMCEYLLSKQLSPGRKKFVLSVQKMIAQYPEHYPSVRQAEILEGLCRHAQRQELEDVLGAALESVKV